MRQSSLLTLVMVAALGAASPARGDSLSVTFTTTPNNGPYAPRNIVAVWIEDAGGNFVKTIGRWAATRKSHLVAWTGKAGTADADAVSGATRQSHQDPLTVTWDLRDRAGAVVPDGTYTIRMELADSNASQPAQNHQGTFTFAKNGTSSSTTNGANGGFNAVAIDYVAAVAAACGNGTVDAGETCDGNCPTTCTPSGDACAPNTLVGTAAACDAACTPVAITACADGDGCCPSGCDSTRDLDCAPGGGGGGGGSVDTPAEITGGCAAGGAAGGALPLVGLAIALACRPRRRR